MHNKWPFVCGNYQVCEQDIRVMHNKWPFVCGNNQVCEQDIRVMHNRLVSLLFVEEKRYGSFNGSKRAIYNVGRINTCIPGQEQHL